MCLGEELLGHQANPVVMENVLKCTGIIESIMDCLMTYPVRNEEVDIYARGVLVVWATQVSAKTRLQNRGRYNFSLSILFQLSAVLHSVFDDLKWRV